MPSSPLNDIVVPVLIGMGGTITVSALSASGGLVTGALFAVLLRVRSDRMRTVWCRVAFLLDNVPPLVLLLFTFSLFTAISESAIVFPGLKALLCAVLVFSLVLGAGLGTALGQPSVGSSAAAARDPVNPDVGSACSSPTENPVRLEARRSEKVAAEVGRMATKALQCSALAGVLMVQELSLVTAELANRKGYVLHVLVVGLVYLGLAPLIRSLVVWPVQQKGAFSRAFGAAAKPDHS